MIDPHALPTGRQGQIAALGGLFVLIVLVWFAVIAPLAGWYADRSDDIDRQRTLLAHLSALAARLPAVEAEFAHAKGRAATVEEATDARAGADLQQQIEAMAAPSGVTLSSVEFLASEPANGYRRIPLRITFTARWPALIALMQAVETASPSLIMDDLHVRVSAGEGNPTPTAEVNLVVTTLRAAAGVQAEAAPDP